MRRYLFIVIGAFLTAIGDAWVIVPLSIINGGPTSLAMILERLIGIDVGVFVFAIRFSLLLICAICLGLQYLKGSLITFLLYLLFFLGLHGVTARYDIAFQGSLWLGVPIGAVLVGCGYGFCIAGESTEVGFDALALILHRKFPHIGIAQAMYAISSIVLLGGIYVFHWQVVVAGLIFALIEAYVLNHVLVWILPYGIPQEG